MEISSSILSAYKNMLNKDGKGEIWLVKLWPGSGYRTVPYFVKAENEYDALELVMQKAYKDSPNGLVIDREEAEKIKDSLSEDGKCDSEEVEQDFRELFIANENDDLFVRTENLFICTVQEDMLKKYDNAA